MKKLLTIVVVIVVLVTIGTVISNQNKGDSETIKIGFIGPITGSLASIGESSLGGALLAVKDINESGGLLGKKVELIVEDDSCLGEKGVNAVSKLINVDKVVAISGPDCSAVGSAVLPVVESNNVPVVIRWASNPTLTSIGDNVFRVYPSDGLMGQFVAKYIYEDLGHKKAALIYVKDPWGQGLSDVFRKTFTDLGGEVVFDEGVLTESVDLRKQLVDIRNSDAKAIFAPLHEDNSVAGLKQMRELDVNIPIIGGDVFESQAILDSQYSDGAMLLVGHINNPSEFQNRIENEIGKNGNLVTAPLGYDSVMSIVEAIKEANSTDVDKIKEALNGISLKGVDGRLIRFDENGDLKDAHFDIKKINSGELKILKTI